MPETPLHTELIKAFSLGIVVEMIPCNYGLIEIRMYPRNKPNGRICQAINLLEIAFTSYDKLGCKIEEMIKEVQQLNQ
ncbi:MAG: hypothetical protein AAF587_29515 [Bacteroidota bacterium]